MYNPRFQNFVVIRSNFLFVLSFKFGASHENTDY